MEIPLLPDIVVILCLSVLVVFIFQKFRLPPILGFLITGIIAGPNGLKLIHGVHEVEILAEIGVILLLFIIGMEFSLKTMVSIQRIVLIGGFSQVGLTIGVTFLGAYALGYPWNESLFLGFLFSLSSTAIVLTLLNEQGAISSPHGRIALAVLIFQDIIVVPMMLFAPLIAGSAENPLMELVWLVIKAIIAIIVVIVSARYLVPRLLDAVARSRSRELFILTVVGICFAVAWGSSSIGLSLALGAFMAGLIISESEYSYQATGLVLPFREIFVSFFFVSIGMLLDLGFFITHLPMIFVLTLAVMIVKALIAGGAALLLGYPPRTALMTGFALFQIGEFAFILSASGIEFGLLETNVYQYFLAISILTMAATPFVMKYAAKMVDWLFRQPIPERLRLFKQLSERVAEEPDEESLRDHVIVIGYGVTGRNVAEAARTARIPYVVLELDPVRVQQARADGHPASYGDAANDFVLLHLHVYSARVAVIAISDVNAAKIIITQIRAICQTVYLIVRTRMVDDIEELRRLGANEVIPEEFETSIEVFTRLLNRYFVPQDEVQDFVRKIRADAYEKLWPDGIPFTEEVSNLLSIPEVNVTCLKVQHGENEVVGQPLAKSNIRARFGVNLLAILRDGQFIADVGPDTVVRQDDILYLIGEPEAIAKFNKWLKY
jgi:CPA2 family monovalent cation:H+ antiporter-2